MLSGNVQNFINLKNQNFYQINSNNPINNLSQHFPINFCNENPNFSNNFLENPSKYESFLNNDPKSLINFNINLHFNLNLFDEKNFQNSLHPITFEKVVCSVSPNKQNIYDPSNYSKVVSKTNNLNEIIETDVKEVTPINNIILIDSLPNDKYLADIEEFCNKYNNKIIDNSDKQNLSYSVNVSNFNNLINKNIIVNKDSKFNDYLYYLKLFNNPETNIQILNFIKNNFDLNKIGEEFKNLIFTETGIENKNQQNENRQNNINNQISVNNYNNLYFLLTNMMQNLNNPTNYINESNNVLNNQNNLNLSNFLNDNKSENQQMNNLYNLVNSGNSVNEKNSKINSLNNENLNELKNFYYLMNSEAKETINDFNSSNNFNKLNNSNKNNKNSVFLNTKTKRKNSNFSETGNKNNLYSSSIEGKINFCQNPSSSNNNRENIFESSNDFEIEQNKNREKNFHYNKSHIVREKDDIYDFLKSKKFHIKKYIKNDQNQPPKEIEPIKPKNLLIKKTIINNNESTNNANNDNNNNNNNVLILPETKNFRENRKFKADSIHKKIKVNVLKYLKATITEFIPNKRLNNLSQEIITNVNISFNKDLLEKQLFKIYEDDYLATDGIECLDNIKNAMDENREFFDMMNLNLKDFIIHKYWKSNFHKKKLSKIFQQESYEYYVNYEFLDKEFINYFLNNKGNKRKLLNNKLTSEDGKSEYSVTASNKAYEIQQGI